jgi:ATP adenylyltransferase
MAEQRLWAPWRLDYIKGPKPDECIFCAKPAEGDDEAAYIVHRAERCFVMLNKFPYNNGHLMVSPYEHVPSLDGLDDDTLLELMQITRRSILALGDVYGPEGFNVGINIGAIAGAGVAGHVHQHVVPRWGADTNYMPVIASTRVLPQSLDDSYAALRGAFSS